MVLGAMLHLGEIEREREVRVVGGGRNVSLGLTGGGVELKCYFRKLMATSILFLGITVEKRPRYVAWHPPPPKGVLES
jgi:hypothetical protein